MSLKGKITRNIYDPENMTPWVHLPQIIGYIHVYGLNSQTRLLVYIYPRSQVSVNRIIGHLVLDEMSFHNLIEEVLFV